MANQLAAVLIGGPPHAGKSVLLYNLTHALYERGVRHHAIRACPDGEGNWFQEGNITTVSTIRDTNKRTWSDNFIRRMSSDLHHRCLPFLVDMGGYPRMRELPLFQQCTHALLLLRADKPEATQLWQQMLTEANLLPLAELLSQQEGISAITTTTRFLQGTITGLKRQSQVVRENPAFMALVARIEALFTSYSSEDLERTFLEQAPTEIVLNLPAALKAFTHHSIYWQPEMLAPFLQSMPQQTPLSVYGWGPNWLYAALIAHTEQQPFYQFDPKLPFGWIQPLPVCCGENQSSEIAINVSVHQDVAVLSVTFPSGRLEYFQPEPLAFPTVAPEHGLILDGPFPYWLLTAIVRLYQRAGIAWIAPHHAQQSVLERRKIAIVAYSRVMTHSIGDLIELPA